MPHKRSRPVTEQRFIDAVLDLVAESGCAELGINLVAQRAGTDKVLIYRYFGDLDGLLRRVAESRAWLPTAEELYNSLTASTPERLLQQLLQNLIQYVQRDATSHQLARWRHAVENPLTEQYSRDWSTLWRELPEMLGAGLDYAERQKWSQACSLLAAVTEAQLMGEPIETSALIAVARDLSVSDLQIDQSAAEQFDEDRLPTNLL